MTARRIFVFLMVGMLLTGIRLAYVGPEPRVLAMAAWNFSPYLAACWLARSSPTSAGLAGLCVLAVDGGVFVKNVVRPPALEDGLLFLIVPALLWGLVGTLAAAHAISGLLRRSEGSATPSRH